MGSPKTKAPGAGEGHYRPNFDVVRGRGVDRLGLACSWAWHDDPRHLLFTMSRYKFVAKMLCGIDRVLEVGCADGFPTRIVAQAVQSVTAIDFDSELIADAMSQRLDRWPITFQVHDILTAPFQSGFDAAYALDVIEHIPQELEDDFVENIRRSLTNTGILILGTPSLQSQVFASSQSKEGHVNCKSAEGLRETLQKHFSNVFIFSMNDEVVHTGFDKMAHYLMALCCAPKS